MTLFEISFLKRLSQFFCKHNYFAVAVTDFYKEPSSDINETVSIYKCEKCEHVRIFKKN